MCGVWAEGEQLGSAVSQLEPVDGSKEGPHATVRFAQVALDRCLVEAILDGFPPGTSSASSSSTLDGRCCCPAADDVAFAFARPRPSAGEYDLAVHEFGDLSDAERSVGGVFGRHPGYADKPAGEIGRVAVGQNGVLLAESGNMSCLVNKH